MSFCEGNFINLADKADKREVTARTARPTADLDTQRNLRSAGRKTQWHKTAELPRLVEGVIRDSFVASGG